MLFHLLKLHQSFITCGNLFSCIGRSFFIGETASLVAFMLVSRLIRTRPEILRSSVTLVYSHEEGTYLGAYLV